VTEQRMLEDLMAENRIEEQDILNFALNLRISGG
jgi:hypothetical protein